MIVDIDTEPGMVFVRDSQHITGLTLDVRFTPAQARAYADGLHKDGHTVAADGLRRAAAEAERKGQR